MGYKTILDIRLYRIKNVKIHMNIVNGVLDIRQFCDKTEKG